MKGPILVLSLTLLAAATFWSRPGSGAAGNPDPQLTNGQARFVEKCARCHGPTMEGIEHAPALKGEEFRAAWDGKTARELYKRIISTMPQDDPGSLPEQDVIGITAYVLAASNFALPAVQKANDLNTIKIAMH